MRGNKAGRQKGLADQITVIALSKKQHSKCCEFEAPRSKKRAERANQPIDAIELSSGFEAATEPKMPPCALIMARPAA